MIGMVGVGFDLSRNFFFFWWGGGGGGTLGLPHPQSIKPHPLKINVCRGILQLYNCQVFNCNYFIFILLSIKSMVVLRKLRGTSSLASPNR